MFLSRRNLVPVFLLCLALTFAACSSGPRQIASYPSGSRGSSRAGPSGSSYELVYSAYLELSVANIEAAAERAEQLAYDYGGYLSSSHFWEQDGRTYATLVLEIPSREFDRVREKLLRLGTLESERTDGEWVGYDSPGKESYSQIILSLKPAGFAWPAIQPPGWRPLRTLERALQVSLAIFGFLLDVLIWIVVIAGPFVLLGWALWKLIPRQRR